MRPPDIIVIEGRAYSWRVILDARRAQLEAWRRARPEQPALFPLREDCRPRTERTAAGRYSEPGLLERQGGGCR